MHAWLELAALVLVLTLLTPRLGGYLAAVFENQPHPARAVLGPAERWVYRLCRIDPAREMTWAARTRRSPAARSPPKRSSSSSGSTAGGRGGQFRRAEREPDADRAGRAGLARPGAHDARPGGGRARTGLSAAGNGGPRGFTEILYAFTSVSANNGSALGGLAIQTGFYDGMTAVVMLLGRFATMAAVLALAGGLVRKARNTKPSVGAFSTATPLFAVLLTATALVVTALTFVPADALGPVAEALLLRGGTSS